ncbi:MMPL family transporter [Nocardia sp. CDC160]|uniref:MMPL family transporter n=1 Tax=Nocardia sp. CDC160 TaxID=3112166 RepID=UPI002DBE9E7C|nr:MMPL family transporter [Nocardia sp. CDC160]MEC3920327.1 MMPL family transporter [Nocardia sp. CDC160]
MSALARWCYRHRFVVVTAWVGALIVLAMLSQAVKATYDNTLTLPGTGSGSAQQLLLRSAPDLAGDSDQIVWQVSQGSVTDPSIEQRMSAMLAQVSNLPEVASIASPYTPSGNIQISQDRRTAYAILNFTKASPDRDDINRVISTSTSSREPGLAVELGGEAISSAEQTTASSASAIGLGAAAVILLIVFGSVLAMALPIVTAAAGVGSGLMLTALLTHLMSVSGIAPILAALIGLGVGIDYALFIVTRHRRGLQAGLDPEHAAVQALSTSGRAVLVAGGTVCIGLLGLLTIGLGFVDGLAVPAAITVVCTMIAAVTLTPALFGVLGARVLSRRQRRMLQDSGPSRADNSGGWARWARFMVRFPAVLACLGLAVMAIVSAPVLHLRLGTADASNDAPSSHTYQAYEMLAEGFGPGFNGPLLVVAQTRSAADRAALDRLDRALITVPGVAAAQTVPTETGPGAEHVAEVIRVLPTTAPEAPATSDLIARLRNSVIPQYTQDTTLQVDVGGRTATLNDFAAVTSARLPWLMTTIVGFSFVLLVLAFRSLLIPALTAALNLLAAAAAFGVLTAFFQWGWGTGVIGLGAASPIEGYLPELVLAILFGLSMDYQVFLVSGMAEEWSHSHDNARAVVAGVTHTARMITAAAMIMIAVFIAFVYLGKRDIAEFGVGLAAAVALDAFVLRPVLVPALMYLCGRANWWMPGWLDRRLPHLAIEPPSQRHPTSPILERASQSRPFP